ncbi:MAG: KAP family NTPase [Magnetococcus sp. MYC-9]
MELDATLSSSIGLPSLRAPWPQSGGQPMLIPLCISSGQCFVLVGRAPRLCFAPDGRAYRRVEGRNEPVPQSGRGLAYRKEAQTEELCLGIEAQAAALAELFAHNEEEFCFALFGQWGRGKTALAKRVQKLLEEQGFHAIPFSAWRHPSTPELFAYLYESFVKTVCDNAYLSGLPVTVRAAMLRYGLWPATLILCQVWFVLLGLQGQWEVLYQLYGVVGMSGLFFLWRVYRSHALVQRLLKRYGHLPRHQEKLGLHASIGEDLRFLLAGWQPFGWIGYSGLGECVALLMYGLAGVAVSWILLPHGNLTPHPLQWWAFGLWWLLLAVTLLLPFVPGRNPKSQRFLLVVDDLDRCDPDIMLHAMESLKLMLEIEDLKRHLQVLMLVDERILRHAILRKHAGLLDESSNQPATRFRPEQIVRENFEKLFTGHFRLLPLTVAEVDSVVDTLKKAAGREHSPLSSDPASSEQPGRSAEGEQPASSPEQTGTGEEAPSLSAATRETTTGLQTYTPEEWEIVRQYLRELAKDGRYDLSGPRSVRYLLNGYQLARLYAQHAGIHPQPDKLVDALRAAHTLSEKELDDKGKEDPWIRIARQVAWSAGWISPAISPAQTRTESKGEEGRPL